MELLALLLICALLAAMILPWFNMGRLNGQGKQLDLLKRELQELKDRGARQAEPSIPAEPSTEAPSAVKPPPVPKVAPQPSLAKASVIAEPKVAQLPVVQTAPRVEPVVEPSEAEETLSQDWFSKLAVWVGGIALLMAGFYMVKYSIESGWLTPFVRVALTTTFGVVLGVSGLLIGMKAEQTANQRIGQALSGAGVACLYFAAYAAVHLYEMMGTTGGFVSMVAVTLFAVVLSLKNGAPIALMGLIGGFLTPLLMPTESADTVLLFSYLFILFSGAQYLCIRRGWWGLLLGSLVAVYLWSLYVIGSAVDQLMPSADGAMLFVLGVCAVNGLWMAVARPGNVDQDERFIIACIRVLTWVGGLGQSLALVWLSGFAAVDMSMFAILSVGALSLAVIKEAEFLWASWAGLAAMVVATLAYPVVEGWSWCLWPSALLILFFVVGHWRALRSEQVEVWRGFSLSSLLGLVPLLYVNRTWVAEVDIAPAGFFLVAALGCAFGVLLAAEHLLRRSDALKTAGEYSAFASFLALFGLWTYVPAQYFPHTIAGLWILGLVYWSRRKLGRMQLMQGVLGTLWGLSMLPVLNDLVDYYFGGHFMKVTSLEGIDLCSWLLGSVALALATYVMRDQSDTKPFNLVRWSLGLVLLITLIATYQWLDETHMPEAWLQVSTEGGLTALLAGLALLLGHLSVRYRRNLVACFIVSGLFLLRVVVLHLGDGGAEGNGFFVDALLLQFGIPFAACFAIAWKCGEAQLQKARGFYQIAAMCLGFIWASFLVQDYFGAHSLIPRNPSDVQVYTYSVVWLLLAVAYQSIGLWRNQSFIHSGSLVLLLLTVGKVFLVDASELEGIFRVFSFLGLGVALIGIGFFYNKVVFSRQQSE
ncbi:MAG: DUF2339 domain-containing protein [Opitutaceae bacterium]